MKTNLNLNNSFLQMSAGRIDQFPRDPIPQIAFSGRSNVGKSSLINTMLGRSSLARVSSAPGKTTTVNFYNIDKKLFFVDLPGYGFAKRTPEERAALSALTDAYFTGNKNLDLLRLVVQLVDSRVGPTSDDMLMLNFLRTNKLNFAVAATKTDKLGKKDLKVVVDALHTHPYIGPDVPVVAFSALNGTGRDELWRIILDN